MKVISWVSNICNQNIIFIFLLKILIILSFNYNNLCIEFSPVVPKQELKIDETLFHTFICKDVMSFWNEIDVYNVDDGIIDLFSTLDNKISQYLQIWDRSTLVTVIIS